MGCRPQTIDALYAAMWEQSVNLGEPDQVSAALSEAGLDGPMLAAKAQEPEIKERLIRNTQSAYDRGAFGSPSFFVGDQLFFGKDRLADVEAEIVRQRDAG
jgi:2-hydroxychromene-2-carboxylate isomerase